MSNIKVQKKGNNKSSEMKLTILVYQGLWTTPMRLDNESPHPLLSECYSIDTSA